MRQPATQIYHQGVCAVQGNEQLCTQLCDLGAVVTVRDDSGNTPLHMAVCLDKRIRDSMVDLLTRRDIMATLVKNKAGLIPSQCSKAKATKRLLSVRAPGIDWQAVLALPATAANIPMPPHGCQHTFDF